MDEILFNDLLDSLKEAEGHAKGKKKLKTTKVNIAKLPDYTPEKIKSIREQMCLTQQSFAELMGISLRTIESWEAGYTHPNGPSRRLLSLLEEKKIAKKISDRIIKIR